jgi:V/A-type H+-transporting ATPase subunit I
MSIAKMNKFTLIFFESQKELLMEKLQSFQGVQFINLQDDALLEKHEVLQALKKDDMDTKYSSYEDNISKIKFCLEIIEQYAPEKSGLSSLLEDKKALSFQEVKEKVEINDWEGIYTYLKEKESALNELINEKTKLEAEVENLSNWMDFDAPFDKLNNLKMTDTYLGTISKQYEKEFIDSFDTEVKSGYYEIIKEDNDDSYMFLLVHKDEVSEVNEIFKKYGFSNLTFNNSNTPREFINECKNKSAEITDAINAVKEEIRGYEKSRENLKLAFEYYNSLILRAKASNNFMKTEKVITLCGWNLLENNHELEKSIKDSLGEDYYLEFAEVSEEEIEDVPIKLDNTGFAGAFENVVEMYSLPLYNEVDPTPILSVFYFIFYGMMLSDAGYGLIMVALSSFLIYKTKDEQKKKNYKLFFYAGISTVIWGAIYGGWFGDLLPKYFGINVPVILDSSKDITTIFILSLAFGVIHIFVGLGIKGYMLIKTKLYKDFVYDVITWYATLIGAILMLVGAFGSLGTILFAAGLVGLLLTQGRSAPTLGGKIGWGIYGVYGITGYLGDIISYSRLLALGLATGFIANALNLIINLVPSPLKYVLAPFLFVGFHTFNLLINALGSYVHAARLQYLEFFSKFYSGGGKKFTPFKHSDKYINIIK